MQTDRLRSAIEAIQERARDPNDVLADVSALHGIPVEELLGRDKSKRVAQARHEAIRDLYFDTELNGPQIAALFGVTSPVVYHVLKKDREGQL